MTGFARRVLSSGARLALEKRTAGARTPLEITSVSERGVGGKDLERIEGGDIRGLTIGTCDEESRIYLHEATRKTWSLRHPQSASGEVSNDAVGRDERVDGTAIAERTRCSAATVVA